MKKRLASILFAAVFAIFPLAMAQEGDKAAAPSGYCISQLPSVQKVPEVDRIPKLRGNQVDGAGYIWSTSDGEETLYSTATFVSAPDNRVAPAVPELYSKQCSYWNYIVDGCFTQYRIHPIFSAAAKVLFINGRPRSLLGYAAPVSYILVGDQVTPLPSNSRHTTGYAGEAPKFNSAILRGPIDELYLYDGNALKELPLGSKPRRDGFPSWLSVLDKETGRVFIRNNGAFADSKPFLFEIVEGPKLKKFDLDESIHGWPTIFSLPGDQQEWLITRLGLYAEKDGIFRPVALTKSPDYIHGPAGIGFTETHQLYFAIQTDEDKSVMRPFALFRKNENQQCDKELNLENTIEIGSK